MSRWKWVLGTMLLSITLAGCTDPGTALSQEAADRLVDQAIKGLQRDMSDPDGGAISKVEGSFSSEDGTGELLIEWGSNDVTHVMASMGSSGLALEFHLWCAGDREITRLGDKVFEAVRDPDEACFDTDDGEADDEMVEGTPTGGLPDPMELDGLERASVKPRTDGTVVATLSSEEGDDIVLTVDAKGRVERLQVDGSGSEADMRFSYGGRPAIEPPAATERRPTEVEAERTTGDGTVSWTIEEVEGTPELSRYEVHVYEPGDGSAEDPFAGPSYGPLVIAFRLEAGTYEDAGYTFVFADGDDDGHLTAGDAWILTFPEGEDAWMYEVALFDTWAEKTTDQQGIPGIAIMAPVALLLVGFALARRRS